MTFIIYQFIFGQDIFGFEGIERRLSGPFGDERIAGSFIQRFSLFALFALPIFYNFKMTKYIKYSKKANILDHIHVI